MRQRSRFLILASCALAGVLIGCGGGGEAPLGGSGGSGGGGALAKPGTARLDINAETGVVTVTPLGDVPGRNQSRSLYTGSAVSITSSNLTNDPSEVTVRKLKLNIKNNTGETLGSEGGARLIIEEITPDHGGALDLRPFTNVFTIVGPGIGAADGPGPSVTINQPTGIARDTDGTLYLAGSADGTLRKMKDNFVTRIATGIASPGGVAVLGGSVFMVEQSLHNLVRVPANGGTKFVMAGGGVSGLVDGSGAAARFNSPRDIELIGSTAFITDTANDRIRTATNLGGGSATVATLNVFPVITGPSGLAHFPMGGIDWLVVTSTLTHKVYLVNSANGQSFIVAGTGALGNIDGPGTSATFSSPFDATVSGNAIFVSDLGGKTIRQITLDEGAQPQFTSSWQVKTISGMGVSGAVDGLGTVAQMASPRFMETDGSGALLVSDLTNNRVRKVTSANGAFPLTGSGGPGAGGTVSVIAPDGYIPDPGNATSRKATYDVASITPAGSQSVDLTIAIENVKHFFIIVSLSAESDTPFALDAIDGTSLDHGSPNVNVRTLAGGKLNGWVDGAPTIARFGQEIQLARNEVALYGSDLYNSNIRRIDAAGNTFTIAGVKGITGGSPVAGTGETCVLNNPTGLVAMEGDTELFATDSAGMVIYRLTRSALSNPNLAASWTVAIIAGAPNTPGNLPGTGLTARFNKPWGLAADSTGNTLFVADFQNNCIKRLEFTGGNKNDPARWSVSFYSGPSDGSPGDSDGLGFGVGYRSPVDVALSKTGDLFVAEFSGHRVRRIDPDRQTTLLAGSATAVAGYVDGDGSAARFNGTYSLALDDGNYLYVGELWGCMVRRINIDWGTVRSVAGVRSQSGGTDGTGDVAVGVDARSMVYDPKRGLIFSSTNQIRLIERIVRNGTP